jgi:hypothetical protein
MKSKHFTRFESGFAMKFNALANCSIIFSYQSGGFGINKELESEWMAFRRQCMIYKIKCA